jgi:hypothetical protein
MVQGVERRVDHGGHNDVGLHVVRGDHFWLDLEEHDHSLLVITWFNLKKKIN